MTGINKFLKQIPITSPYLNPSQEDKAYKQALHKCEEIARRLAAEEAKECSKNPNVHESCTEGKSEQAKEKPTPADEYLEHSRKHPIPDIPSRPSKTEDMVDRLKDKLLQAEAIIELHDPNNEILMEIDEIIRKYSGVK